jgi:hypothetical protein
LGCFGDAVIGEIVTKGSILTPTESKMIFRKEMRDKMKKDREHDIKHKAAVMWVAEGESEYKPNMESLHKKVEKNGTSPKLNMRFWMMTHQLTDGYTMKDF